MVMKYFLLSGVIVFIGPHTSVLMKSIISYYVVDSVFLGERFACHFSLYAAFTFCRSWVVFMMLYYAFPAALLLVDLDGTLRWGNWQAYMFAICFVFYFISFSYLQKFLWDIQLKQPLHSVASVIVSSFLMILHTSEVSLALSTCILYTSFLTEIRCPLG